MTRPRSRARLLETITKRFGRMATKKRIRSTSTLDPTRTLDRTDPGDQTLRNFRYQLLYGVILLVAASAGRKPYVAVWCEHYEDFLCERPDGTFDGIQVKTRQPETGFWQVTDEPFVKTIGRFVDLNARLGSKLAAVFFVSNAKCDELGSDNKDDKRRARCPKHLIEHVHVVTSPSMLSEPFKTVLQLLQAQCGSSEAEIFDVFKKMDIVHGPSREDIDASVSNEHLGGLIGFDSLSPKLLADARDNFVSIVHRASSLHVTDPDRHLRGLLNKDHRDPALSAKRLEVAHTIILPGPSGAPTFVFQDKPILTFQRSGSEGSKGTSSVLEQKLLRGDIGDQFDYLHSKALAAEFAIMMDISKRPAAYPLLQVQIEQVVLSEVAESYLQASTESTTFGRPMMIDLQKRLRAVAAERADQIGRHSYDCLVGVAGLLTDECRIWWSERFDLVVGGLE